MTEPEKVPAKAGSHGRVARKIDPAKLKELWGGKTQKELAAIFGVHPANISRAAKAMGLISPHAKEYKDKVQRQISRNIVRQAFDQSQEYYERGINLEREFVKLMSNMQGLSETLKNHILESGVIDTDISREFRETNKALRDTMLALLDIEKILRDRRNADLFRQMILEEIGQVDTAMKGRLLERIRAAEWKFTNLISDRSDDSTRSLEGPKTEGGSDPGSPDGKQDKTLLEGENLLEGPEPPPD